MAQDNNEEGVYSGCGCGEVQDSPVAFDSLDVEAELGGAPHLRLENSRPLNMWANSDLSPNQYVALAVKKWRVALEKGVVPRHFEAPVTCQLELTARCNQRCLHCYNRSAEKCSMANELSNEEWMGVIEYLKKNKVYEVILSGGEPLLLGDDLFRIMDTLAEPGRCFVLISNGILMTEKAVKRLKEFKADRYAWVQISMDGVVPEVHDKIRGVKCWHKAAAAAHLVKDAGLPLVIAHVVTSQNIDTFGDMVDFSFHLGAKRIIAGPVMYSGRAILNRTEIELSPSQLDEYYKIVKAKARMYRGSMDVTTALDTAMSIRLNVVKPSMVMLFRPNGDVRLDCSLPFKVGNIREEAIEDIWQKRAKHAWKTPMLLDYISKVKCEDDVLNVRPRPYVDPDIFLEVDGHES